MLLAGSEVFAVTRDARFLYRPDPATPASNAFVPTTLRPCNPIFSCRANEYEVYIPSMLPGPISAGPAARSTPMFRVSSEWRPIPVQNGTTGHRLTADVRVTAVYGWFNFTPSLLHLVPEADGDQIAAYEALFGGPGSGSWRYPPAPCTDILPGYFGSATWQAFFIRTASVPCMKSVTRDIPQLTVTDVILLVEFRLPRPQLAQAGLYSGMVRYSVGPGMDIDFGDAVLPRDPELLINLELEVDPIFKVEFPGGSTLLSLEPDGGWLNWLNRGRKPTRLWREQAFNFSTSIPFKMIMQCEHTSGNHCAIAANDGHQVPVEIRMTLPPGMQDSAGRPVRDYLLNPHETPQLDPTRIILGQKGKLQFEVPRPDMESMLDHAGKAYSGQVTFIWDAQL